MCEITASCKAGPVWWIQIDQGLNSNTPENITACNRHFARACREIHKRRRFPRQTVTMKYAHYEVVNGKRQILGYA